jgi:hypothetical protein
MNGIVFNATFKMSSGTSPALGMLLKTKICPGAREGSDRMQFEGSYKPEFCTEDPKPFGQHTDQKRTPSSF